MHLKDYACHLKVRQYLHPGEGQIDFRRFVQQLREAGFDGALSLEARAIDQRNEVEVARLQHSLHYIRSLLRD
ncbi:hypothetical protein KTH_51320 [Thermosporothrix hazakensis]|nr:hypothetical protein KTH_51320 [Thermosporothrix hazakensis]